MSSIFFILLLLSIAFLPIIKPVFWDSNLNKATLVSILVLPILIFYLISDYRSLLHSLSEYFSFIVLLWALFTISGGIVVTGDIQATPKNNTIILLIGAVLANFLGTTGASMILIRPILNINADRQFKKHIIIFFIFLVGNIGGSLTPIGDPPLFLGYLKGIPFLWTLRLWYIWLTEVVILLVVFYFWDKRKYRLETPLHLLLDKIHIRPIRIKGTLNLIFILGVLLAVILSPIIQSQLVNRFGLPGFGEGAPYREIIIILMGLLSLRFSRKAHRKLNDFNFHAIIEVGVLFLGIFITMTPVLDFIKSFGPEMGLIKPYQYFWTTGLLSAFLDNAPTYMIFATLGQSTLALESLLVMSSNPLGIKILMAISIGAVFMGAATYIGNAPNFMIKVIAEKAGEKSVDMPSFIGYMKYSLVILIPSFIIISLLYFI